MKQLTTNMVWNSHTIPNYVFCNLQKVGVELELII